MSYEKRALQPPHGGGKRSSDGLDGARPPSWSAVSVAPGKKKAKPRRLAHARRHHGREGHPKARQARRPRSPYVPREHVPERPLLRQDAANHRPPRSPKKLRSEGAGRCNGSVGRSQGPCRGGPAAHHDRLPVHRSVATGPPLRAERTARAVPTWAAERAAAQEHMKARGYEHRQLRIGAFGS